MLDFKNFIYKYFNKHVTLLIPVIYMAQHKGVEAKTLRSVRTVMSGAAPLGGTDVERFLNKYEKLITIYIFFDNISKFYFYF